MVGPVFSLDLLLAGRRGRLAAFRRVYAAWAVLQFAILFVILFHAERQLPHRAGAGPFLQLALQILLGQEFVLLFLATPAFVAGALTDEKVQGTLAHLLTADLTPREIVLGKFLGRMTQVAMLALVEWPLLGFLAGYGRLGGRPILCTLLLAGLLFLALGALSLWASVRSRQTRDAVLWVYAWVGLGALAVWGVRTWIDAVLWNYWPGSPTHQALVRADELLHCLNPLYVLEPAWSSENLPEFFRRLRVMLLVFGPAGAVSLVWAVLRFRAIYLRQLEAVSRARRVRARRARPVGDDPVRWRERTAGRRRLLQALGIALTAGLTAWSSRAILPNGPFTAFMLQGLAAGFLASLVAGVRASGAISGERERRTWESLLLTPLETWELIEDKVQGTLEGVYPYLLAFAAPALFFSYRAGIPALVGTLAMLAFSWVLTFYLTATGIEYSARSASSWRSLVATLASGYGYCLAVASLLAIVYLWFGCVLGPVVSFFLRLAGITTISTAVILGACLTACAATAWVFYQKAHTKIAYAESRVDDCERYGRTFVRSLTKALRKHYEQQEEQRRRPPAAACQPAAAGNRQEAAGRD